MWEITYESVAIGDYEFKFVIDNAWSNGDFGSDCTLEQGKYYKAYKNGGNCLLSIMAKSNITLRLDLRNYDGTNGADMIAVVTPVPMADPYSEDPGSDGYVVYNTENISYDGYEAGYDSYSGWEKFLNVNYRTTLKPLPGFILPDEIEVSRYNGDVWESLLRGNDYGYNNNTGQIEIFSSEFNYGTVKITAVGVEVNTYPMYIVAGSGTLTGADWKGTWVDNDDNIMSLDDSKYVKRYKNVQAGDYEFKVVKFDSGGWDTWIGENDNNVSFSVSAPCDVIITYDPATNDIDVQYVYVSSLTVAGTRDDSDYRWLNDQNWNASYSQNHMEEIEPGIWQKTYINIKPKDFEIKLALNDTWDMSFGTDCNLVSGTYYDAIRYNNAQDSGKCTFTLADIPETTENERYNITIRADFTEYDPVNGTGAKIMMKAVVFENIPVIGGEILPSGLVDHKVNNLVYSGSDERYYNGYVSTLYPLEGYKLPSSVSIYCEDDTSIVMEEGVHYTYDSSTGKILIKENAQSYTLLSWPSGATTIIEAEAVPIYPLYLVAGDAAFTGSDWNDEKDGNEANHMTKVGSEFVKTYTNVPIGNYSLKVVKYGDENANPTWIGKDGTDADVTFSVGTACDVTVKYNPATNKITVEGVGLVDYLFEHMSIAGETALFGSNWTPIAMTYSTASGKWEYTLTNVSAGDYLYKYTADSAWTHSWGDEGWYGSSVNYPLSVEYDGSTVIFKVDLSGADMLNPSSVQLTNTEVEIIKPVYDVTFDLDSEITKTGNDTVTAGDVYTATLNAASGFNLPSDKSGIIITINGSRLEEQYYEYNSTTGIISIQSGVIIGDVDIAASATPVLPDEYDVTPPADNNIDITGESTATEGEEYSMTLIPKTGYVLPQSIIIRIGGVETDDFTYNNETGKITIPGDKVNGEIEVIAVAQVIDDESNNQNESTENESTENESTNSGESTEESTNSGESTEESTTKEDTTEESTTKDGTTEEKTTEEGTNNKNDSSNNLNNQAGNGLGGSGDVGGQNSSNAKPGDSAGSKLVVFVFMAAVGALGLMFSNKKRTLTE
ncbi:MAG: hypothetical protein IJD58_04355 [Lachnospiraceae bacterium]|nr:hypothetical protein [Lachnospiraceae bacterium]